MEIAATQKDKDEEMGQAPKKGGGKGGRKMGTAGSPQLIRLMAEMTLQGAAVQRDLAGALYDTILLPAEGDVVKSLADEGTKYHEQATAAGAGHSLGPPHLHIWLKLVEVLLQDPKLAPDDRSVLQGYLTEAMEAEPDGDAAVPALAHVLPEDEAAPAPRRGAEGAEGGVVRPRGERRPGQDGPGAAVGARAGAARAHARHLSRPS